MRPGPRADMPPGHEVRGWPGAKVLQGKGRALSRVAEHKMPLPATALRLTPCAGKSKTSTGQFLVELCFQTSNRRVQNMFPFQNIMSGLKLLLKLRTAWLLTFCFLWVLFRVIFFCFWSESRFRNSEKLTTWYFLARNLVKPFLLPYISAFFGTECVVGSTAHTYLLVSWLLLNELQYS